jgi:hypothetical protein
MTGILPPSGGGDAIDLGINCDRRADDALGAVELFAQRLVCGTEEKCPRPAANARRTHYRRGAEARHFAQHLAAPVRYPIRLRQPRNASISFVRFSFEVLAFVSRTSTNAPSRRRVPVGLVPTTGPTPGRFLNEHFSFTAA